MTNLEPIVRKLISSNMLCCNPQDALSTYFLYYGDKHLSRAKNQDESQADQFMENQDILNPAKSLCQTPVIQDQQDTPVYSKKFPNNHGGLFHCIQLVGLDQLDKFDNSSALDLSSLFGVVEVSFSCVLFAFIQFDC